MTEVPLGQMDMGVDAATSANGQGAIRVEVEVIAKLNLADFQNAVPALQALAVVNDTPAPLQG